MSNVSKTKEIHAYIYDCDNLRRAEFDIWKKCDLAIKTNVDLQIATIYNYWPLPPASTVLTMFFTITHTIRCLYNYTEYYHDTRVM